MHGVRKWFIVAAVVIAVGLVIVSRIAGNDSPEPAPTSSAPATSEFTTDSLLSVDLAAGTAAEFVRLWSMPQPGDTAEVWEERLDALVTDDLGRGLLVTDLDVLPRKALSTATPPDIRAVSTSSATVVVTLEDGSEIACEVVIYGPSYAVSSFAGIGDGA